MDKASRKEMNRKLLIPRGNTFVIAMLMVLCIFLPYAIATERYAQDFATDAVGIEELNLTIEDLETVSMAKYARIYFSMRDQLNYRGEGLVLTLLVVLIGCFALAAALFGLRGNPIPSVIFTALTYGVFALQNWDYTDRGVIPSRYYDWGIAHTLLPIFAALAAANALWLLAEKSMAKKRLKAKASVQSVE